MGLEFRKSHREYNIKLRWKSGKRPDHTRPNKFADH